MDQAEILAEESNPYEKSCSLFVKGIREDKREATFVASTADVDRDGDVIDQASWNLSFYKQNPVVLYAHNNQALPIGKGIKYDLNEDGNLEIDVKFAPEDANPEAEKVWKLYKGGFLRAVSVGFRPKDVRVEKRDDRTVYVLSKCELYELSVVPVGSNRSALARMKEKALAAYREKSLPALPPAPPAAVAPQDKAAAGGGTMDPKEFEAKLASVQADCDAKLKASEAKSATLTERLTVVEGELAKERAKSSSLELQGVEKELDELIGKKISPAEKPGLLKLAGLDRAAFNDHLATIKGRPDMGLIGPVVTVKDPAPNSLPQATGADNGSDFEGASA